MDTVEKLARAYADRSAALSDTDGPADLSVAALRDLLVSAYAAGFLAVDPVGPREIAERLGRPLNTVHKWTQRPGFPRPWGEVSGSPWYPWPAVEEWHAIPRYPGRPRGDERQAS
jgi:hypothetical protein